MLKTPACLRNIYSQSTAQFPLLVLVLVKPDFVILDPSPDARMKHAFWRFHFYSGTLWDFRGFASTEAFHTIIQQIRVKRIMKSQNELSQRGLDSDHSESAEPESSDHLSAELGIQWSRATLSSHQTWRELVREISANSTEQDRAGWELPYRQTCFDMSLKKSDHIQPLGNVYSRLWVLKKYLLYGVDKQILRSWNVFKHKIFRRL